MCREMDMRFWPEQADPGRVADLRAWPPRTATSAYRYPNGKHLAVQCLLGMHGDKE
jgi:hypothetical protein